MDNEKEFELIRSFINGNENAFNRLIRVYQKTIYWYARRMVGNHFDADEVTQQVIIIIFNKLYTFKFQSSLKTWIYKITITRSLNLIKKRKIRKILNIADSNVTKIKNNDDIINQLEDREKIEKINVLLNALPVKQREIFVLRHFDELSYEEISEITGKSVGGLKANYFHASKKIFGMMKNYE